MKILILNISCTIAFFSCNNTNVHNSVVTNNLINDSLQVISKIDTINSLITPAKIGVINDTLKNSNSTSNEEPIKIQPNDNFYVEGSSIRLRDSINYFIVMYNKTHLKFKNKGTLNKKNVDSTIWENWQDLIIINNKHHKRISFKIVEPQFNNSNKRALDSTIWESLQKTNDKKNYMSFQRMVKQYYNL